MKSLKSILAAVALLLIAINIQGQDIFEAVKKNDLQSVKSYIEKDTSLLNSIDLSGNTPLHIAAMIGSVPIADFLLSNGAEIDALNTQMNSPLHESIRCENDDISKLLIEKGADINKKNINEVSVLHFAAMKNRRAIAELLIAKGADIECKDRSQYTPLGLIARTSIKCFDVAELLIQKGANVDARDANGTTPLENAIVYSDDKTIDLLLDNNAVFDTTQENLAFLLSYSAQRGHERLFKLIVEKEGNDLFKNEVSNKRLMRNAIISGSLEIVEILQSKNIPLDFSANINGLTPLHGLVSNQNALEMIEFIVKNGADINALTNDGRSAYNIADASGNKEALSLILKLGGNAEPQKFPELRGPYLGQTPPGIEAKRFAPGIVISDHGTMTISPDGNEIYWGTGTSIMMTKIQDGKWTMPNYAPFSSQSDINFYDDVPFITPDNKKLFFTSKRLISPGSGTKENIWFVERTKDGWSEPKPVNALVNGLLLHWQVSVSNSGTLYFGGTDQSGYGGGDIYYSKLVDGEYTKPVNLGPIINSNNGESMPYIAPDESYILFYRIAMQRGTLHISFKSKDGQWMQPVKIDQIPAYVGVNVTSDSKYIFTYNLWASARFIDELRPKE
ncbi:MAG: ankyrin repeat domain-containing protein [Tenuifilaceae bacterium]